jgi:subtilisin family serine protease
MSNQSIVGNIDGSGNVFPGYADWLSATGFDGSGVIVGVVDGYVRTSHNDLADRMVPCTGPNNSCTTSATSAHGTHVAGAIAGTGATGAVLNVGTLEDPVEFLRGQGVAPGANLVTQRYQPFLGAGPGGMVPDGMLDIYQDSARSGALLSNNSWGPSTTPQGYNIPTQQIDFISRDADPETPGDQPVLAVWSIMNGNGDSGGACAPSSLGSPDEAKNLFAVGSTALQSGSNGSQLSNIFRISSNSAHGNACDGRRVPHIVTPGCFTDSTTNSSDNAHAFSGFCGTSMASPVVSGAVALFIEKYVAEHGQPPSPALVKAVFTAAAQDLEGNQNADGGIMGHRPDRFQGYGRIDLDAVMNPGFEVYMSDQETVFTSTGDSWSVALNAVDPSQPIRIMLAWTDAPGAGLAGTTPAWVNNLDLAVEANGSTYLGNVIGSDGWSATGGSADDRNNLEGVFLSPVQHGGAVEITVDATDIAGDALNPWSPGAPSQDFALTCYNCIIGDPTFSIILGGNPLEACIPESASRDYSLSVNLSPIGPYSGTVDLSSTGLPVGVSEVFASPAVSVPGSTNWILTIDSSATEGSSTVEVIGNDGIVTRSAFLDLDLDPEIGIPPSLSNPADGASDLDLQPTLSWDPIAGIEEYQLIVFPTDIPVALVDTVVNGTSFQIPVELETGTSYSWRVAGRNNCGEGTYSETRTFITRLEPVAAFSGNEFALTVPADSDDSASLEISNTGTGNLSWSVATDQIASVAGRGAIDPIYDEPLNVPDFSVSGDASGGNTEVFTIPGGALTQGTVLGFEFEGTVSGITGESDWASDLRMIITSPGGDSFNVGGFSSIVNDWDFQGSGSTNDGTYTSIHPAAFDPGTGDDGDWTLSFQHGWASGAAGTMSWTNVSVTLLKAPPPFCVDPLTAVSWLSVAPDSGSVPQGSSEMVSVDIDTTGMAPGSYTGYLCISTNDPNAALTPMPVELTVTENLELIFRDRFEN